MIFSDSELKLTPEARAIQAIVQICDTVSLKTKHEVLVAVRDFAIIQTRLPARNPDTIG